MVPLAVCSVLMLLSSTICAKCARAVVVCCSKFLSSSTVEAPSAAPGSNSRSNRPISDFTVRAPAVTVFVETTACFENSIPALALFGSRCRHQHVTGAVRLHRRHQSRPLHLLDQARRAVITDPQVALHQRDRCAPGLQHDLDGLVVEG